MVVVRSQAEVNPPVTQQIGGVDLIGSGADGTGQLHYRGCPGVRDGLDTPSPPNRYLSTCWMVQRLTSRRLASSRWLTPFDRFTRSITDTSFTYVRDEESIGEEAALDGLYVLRTNVDEEQLDTAGVVLAYKSLAHVEQAFRHFKLSDQEVRPIYHYTEPRVRAHLLLCMLAYWVQREMQRALAPLLFVDEAPPARPGGASTSLRDGAGEVPDPTHRRWVPRPQLPDPIGRLGHHGQESGDPHRSPRGARLRPGDRANPASSSSLGVVTATHQPFVARGIVQSSPFRI